MRRESEKGDHGMLGRRPQPYMVSLRLVAKWSRSAPGECVSRQSPSFSLTFLRPSSDRFLLLAHWLLRPVRSHYLTLSYHLPR